MAKTRYGVRFTYKPNDWKTDKGVTLLEQLRYMQLVRLEPLEGTDGEGWTVTALPPHGVASDLWARMNANRMHTFGFRDAAPVVV